MQRTYRQKNYDQNDCDESSPHYNTPQIIDFDVLGRAFQTTDTTDSPPPAGAGGGNVTSNVSRVTHHTLDITGRILEVTDALGRLATQNIYALSEKHLIYTGNIDSGNRWMLNNTTGNSVLKVDNRQHLFFYLYDELQRRTKTILFDDSNSPTVPDVKITELITYGDEPATNSIGQIAEICAQDGKTTFEYDFKGNIILSRKQFTTDYNMITNWDEEVDLQLEEFVTQTEYDALNRPVAIVHPDNSIIGYEYDKGGLLQKVFQDATEHVTNITYNPKGQRENIYYGNNTKTRYYYNPLNFRLTRLLTTRNIGQDILQDLNYDYDTVGNIIEIRDDAQQTIYFNNQVIAPIANFEYDALYRLTKATGRELTALTAPNENDFVNNIPCPNNASNAMQNYVHNYEYDLLGNMLSDAWKTYQYDPECNFLLGNDNIANQFTYDAHGNMTLMSHLSLMSYDSNDRLFSAGNGTFTSYYNYDAQGNRTRKVVEKGNIIEERYYIGGYEIFRKYVNETLDFERTTVNISDDKKVFVRVETETGEDPVTRYQYDNHIGSACLELDENGDIISYEEYHPFGTTSYRAGRSETEVSLKRYKYNGKERDEETGLYYYGARYYAAWLCRFISIDRLSDNYPHINGYCYTLNNPVNLIDPDGNSPDDPKTGEIAFIDSSSGKYLGSHTSDKIEGFSVRSIASGDFNNLQNNDFADSRFFSIDKSSKEVTVNYDQIAGAIGSILEKTDKMVAGNFQEIEKALFIVFDKEQSSIYAIEQDYSNNTGGTAEHSSTSIVGMNSHSIISDNRNLVIIAEMHTHPEGSITEFSENTKLIGSYQYRDAGVSPDDTANAQKFLAPVYAIAKFKTNGTKGNIYRVNPDGTGADNKDPIANINSINNKSFNIVRDAFKNRHY